MHSLERKPGVTVPDLTEHGDVRNDRIFTHVDFAETPVDDLVSLLKEDGLGDSLQVIDRNEQRGKYDIGIKVKDENLKRLIDFIACLISSLEDNIRYMWIYKKKPTKSGSWDLDWYESFYGKERTDKVLREVRHKSAKIKQERNKKKKHEMRQYGEKLFRLGGRGVVGIYHCEIVCDKYQYPLDDSYKRYREFVREVVNKGNHRYSHLIHDLLNLVYPEPLRRLHEADPYLKEYVNHLPDKPVTQWADFPVI